MRLRTVILAVCLLAVPSSYAAGPGSNTTDGETPGPAPDAHAYGSPTHKVYAGADADVPNATGHGAVNASTDGHYDLHKRQASAGAHADTPGGADGVYTVYHPDGTVAVYRESNDCPGLQLRDTRDCNGEDERVVAQSPPSPSQPGVPSAPQPSTPAPPAGPGAPSPPDPGPGLDPIGAVEALVSTVTGLIPGVGEPPDPGQPAPDPDPNNPGVPNPSPGTPTPDPNPSPPTAPEPPEPEPPAEPPEDPGSMVPSLGDVENAVNDLLSQLPPL